LARAGASAKKDEAMSELEDTPAVRGMITKVAYLVRAV